MPSRPIYMDHHATTPADPRVVEAMGPWFTEQFGNAASRTHAYGWAAAEAVEQARRQVGALVMAIGDLAVSAGAACSSASDEPSHVLAGAPLFSMGLQSP